MATPFTRFSADSPYAYACGVFPCMELMRLRPDTAYALLWDPAGARNEGMTRLLDICNARGLRVEEAPVAVRRISGKDNTYAVMAFRRYDDILERSANHIMLHHTADMGNMGTIMRTALGFGFIDIAVICPAADPFHPQAVRASMGAQFGLRLKRYDDLAAYTGEHHDRTFLPLALTQEALPLDEAVRSVKTPYTVMLGNEASGLPDEALHLGRPVVIPHGDGIDSLNVAVAAGIAMYALVKGG